MSDPVPLPPQIRSITSRRVPAGRPGRTRVPMISRSATPPAWLRAHRLTADPGARPGVLRVRRATRSTTVIPVAISRRNRPAAAPRPGPAGRR